MAARRRNDARCVVELGRGCRADALQHAAGRAEHLEASPGAPPAELDERALQGTDEGDEAQARLNAPRHLPLQDERRERCAVRISQRSLERLEGLLAARPHARERHAFGREHLMRDERAAFEQGRAQLGQQREAGGWPGVSSTTGQHRVRPGMPQVDLVPGACMRGAPVGRRCCSAAVGKRRRCRRVDELLRCGEAAKPVMAMAKRALDNGLYLMTHWNVVMVCPPLTITREELDEGIAVLDDALSVADEFVD